MLSETKRQMMSGLKSLLHTLFFPALWFADYLGLLNKTEEEYVHRERDL